LGPFPQKVLNSITSVINESQILGARYDTESTSKGKRFTLILDLSDEGKKRIWQFTRDRVNSQLLITVDGVAIAAPIIAHPIADNEISIRGLEDESLVKEAVATINEKRATSSK
jgi:preprotein translocase subunit SecD